MEVTEETFNHRSGEFGIGASKAQHFIQHIRDNSSDKNPQDWRNAQEHWAEAAQMAICEELECPVCETNCKVFTGYHWDVNRAMHGDPPKYDTSKAVHTLVKTAVPVIKMLE